MRLIEFWLNHRNEFLAALTQHLLLVILSTGVAVIIGIPFGIIASRHKRLGQTLLGLASIVQTIPSLAMFGFLIPLPFIGGIGVKAALIVLILYALLPVIQTTLSGIRGIDPVIREAGLALGMTDWQLLFQVELPLALNSIFTGIRVATVVGVGTATIAAGIGAGGLGEYIFRGIASVDNVVILAGAIPAALLALGADFLLGSFAKNLAPERRQAKKPILIIASTAIAIALTIIVALRFGNQSKENLIVIGGKGFTEQFILGELIAQTIERNTSLTVIRKLDLGDTLICETAINSGEIDAYVEYTGTAFTTVFKQPIINDSNEILRRVSESYAATGRVMLPPLGFNNTFAILVRGAEARKLGLRTISEAAVHSPKWQAGFGPAFLDREDGYRGLVQAYGLRFAQAPKAMNLALTYRGLADGQLDLIAGDSTNGLIDKLDLFMLEDDRKYFPPYQAVPILRKETLQRQPQLKTVIEKLAGKISEKEMRQMNYAADVEHQDPAAIARNFLNQHPEIGNPK